MVHPARPRPEVGEAGRAYLACNDEPYSLELIPGDEPGSTTTPSSCTGDASLDDARRHLESAAAAWRESEGCLYVDDPDGRVVELMPHRKPEAEVDRWPQHARPPRPSTSAAPGGWGTSTA